jgi:hypothetical protein
VVSNAVPIEVWVERRPLEQRLIEGNTVDPGHLQREAEHQGGKVARPFHAEA